MRFSPSYLSSLIVEPLRFYYHAYGPADLTWDADPKISNIEIDTINNFNKIAIQSKPRILVSRGGYSIASTGLTDNLAFGTSTRAAGISSERKILFASGQAQILIESVNEGTCEKIVELTSDFITKSANLIANTQGFKQFGIPLSVSPCTPGKEDTEIFTATLSFPWVKESSFNVQEDGIEFKNFLLSVTPVV